MAGSDATAAYQAQNVLVSGLIEDPAVRPVAGRRIRHRVMFALVGARSHLVYGTCACSCRAWRSRHAGRYGGYWLFTLAGLSPLLALFVTRRAAACCVARLSRLFRACSHGIGPRRLEANSAAISSRRSIHRALASFGERAGTARLRGKVPGDWAPARNRGGWRHVGM